MAGQLIAGRCYHCGRPRPVVPGTVAVLGLEAQAAGRPLGWLCATCEGLPGAAWAFVDAARAWSPAAEVSRTAVVGQEVSQIPLVLPSAAPGNWLAMSPFGPAARARH